MSHLVTIAAATYPIHVDLDMDDVPCLFWDCDPPVCPSCQEPLTWNGHPKTRKVPYDVDVRSRVYRVTCDCGQTWEMQ